MICKYEMDGPIDCIIKWMISLIGDDTVKRHDSSTYLRALNGV